MAGKFRRKTTGKTTWEEATAYATALEAAGSWDGTLPPAIPPPVDEQTPPRTTIAEAFGVFLATREATVAHPTYRKYKTFSKQLQAYADSLGYAMLDQFRPGDIDIFYTKSTLGPRATYTVSRASKPWPGTASCCGVHASGACTIVFVTVGRETL